jgi:uncharacterized protein with FMN-binding domain
MQARSNSSKQIITTGAFVTATSILLGVGVSACNPSTQTTSDTTPLTQASNYKDGTYTVMGDYTSPGGEEQIEVTVTLANNQVTSAEVTPQATRPMSQKFQGIFKDNFKEFVMGKNISEIQLDAVSGSSLTPKGFNNALEKIKAEAQV